MVKSLTRAQKIRRYKKILEAEDLREISSKVAARRIRALNKIKTKK